MPLLTRQTNALIRKIASEIKPEKAYALCEIVNDIFKERARRTNHVIEKQIAVILDEEGPDAGAAIIREAVSR